MTSVRAETVQQLAKRLESLERKIESLQTERDILDALYRRSDATDYSREEEWMDCYTEDGIHAIHRLYGGAEVRAAGREELLHFVREHFAKQPKYRKHLMAKPRIKINGKKATVESVFVVVSERDDQVRISSFGHYVDELVKCPDGVWRFTLHAVNVEGRTKA